MNHPNRWVLIILLLGIGFNAGAEDKAVETEVKKPLVKHHSIDSAEGRAMHQQMMMMQANQQQFARQQNLNASLDAKAKLENEIKMIDQKLADGKTTKKEKKQLLSKRAELQTQLQAQAKSTEKLNQNALK